MLCNPMNHEDGPQAQLVRRMAIRNAHTISHGGFLLLDNAAVNVL